MDRSEKPLQQQTSLYTRGVRLREPHPPPCSQLLPAPSPPTLIQRCILPQPAGVAQKRDAAAQPLQHWPVMDQKGRSPEERCSSAAASALACHAIRRQDTLGGACAQPPQLRCCKTAANLKPTTRAAGPPLHHRAASSQARRRRKAHKAAHGRQRRASTQSWEVQAGQHAGGATPPIAALHALQRRPTACQPGC